MNFPHIFKASATYQVNLTRMIAIWVFFFFFFFSKILANQELSKADIYELINFLMF